MIVTVVTVSSPAAPTASAGSPTLAATSVNTGLGSVCAKLEDRSTKCWGLNLLGELGLGDTANRGDQPGQMGDALQALDLGGGQVSSTDGGDAYRCAVLDDDSAKCWGRNSNGQLGLGDTNDRGDEPDEIGAQLTAIDLGPSAVVKQVAAGSWHSCAVLEGGTVKCWGQNSHGQLGQGDTDDRGDEPDEMGAQLIAIDLGPSAVAKQVATSGFHSCALLDSGAVKCWGNNGSGQLGQGDTNNRGDEPDEMGAQLLAIDLGTNRHAVSVAVGHTHSCALLDDGAVKCWGYGRNGTLGQGNSESRGDQPLEMGDALAPVDLGTNLTASAIDTHGTTVCAVLSDQSLKCWGNNTSGQLGLGDTDQRGDGPGEMGDFLPTVDLGAGASVDQVTVGSIHTCALLTNGSVKCWGYNGYGQLGLGDTIQRGDGPGEMGDALPHVDLGSIPAPPPDPWTSYSPTLPVGSLLQSAGIDLSTNGQVVVFVEDRLPLETAIWVATAPSPAYDYTGWRLNERVTIPAASGPDITKTPLDVRISGDGSQIVYAVETKIGSSSPTVELFSVASSGGSEGPTSLLPSWLTLTTDSASFFDVDSTGEFVTVAGYVDPSGIDASSPTFVTQDLEDCAGTPCDLDTDVYALDVTTGEPTSLTVAAPSGRNSDQPAISGDGQWVAFASTADFDGLESSQIIADYDIFVVARSNPSAAKWRVSRSPDGTVSYDDSSTPNIFGRMNLQPELSSDGRFVTYVSSADNLVDDAIERTAVVLHDRNSDGNETLDEPAGTSTTQVSPVSSLRDTYWPTVSDDGRRVSWASNTPSGDRFLIATRDTTSSSFAEFTPQAEELELTSPLKLAQQTLGRVSGSGQEYAFVTTGADGVSRLMMGVLGFTNARFADVSPETLDFTGQYRPVVSDPVNTATGDLVAFAVDLSAPAGAPDLTFARSYDSSRWSESVLGAGWVTDWDVRIDATQDKVTYFDEYGRPLQFVGDGVGGWVRPEELFADYVATAAGHELRWFNGNVWAFEADGLLVSKTAWDGNGVTLVRDADSLIERIDSTTGQSMTFAYDTSSNGTPRLTDLVMSDGRTATYTYGSNSSAVGVLVAVTNPIGSTSYGHDDLARIVSETDSTGVVAHQTEYDPNTGRVARQVLPHGEETLFSYDDDLLTTTVTDLASGDVVVYAFDEQARIESITDPSGNQTLTNWNPDGQATGSTDRLGHSPAATYDANGNATSMTDPLQGTTTYTYDLSNRVVSITEPTGSVTSMTYNADERIPSSMTDGLGNLTSFTVEDGLITTVADADGVATSFTYDAQRRMTETTNGLGHSWSYEYDAVGRQTASTTPLGFATSRTFDDAGRMLTSTTADGGLTTYAYDTQGRVVSTADPVGAVMSNSYDPVTGLLSTTTDPEGRVSTFTYDELSQLVAVEANDSGMSETDYGTLGRVTASRDPLGRETTYAYDANGNRTEVVAPDGGVTRTEYDTAGRVAALEDSIGRRTTHTYDDFGRLVTVTRADGTQMSYTYDLLGRQIETIAPDGGVTATAFTSAGRTSSVTDPVNGVTAYAYDAAGQMDAVTDPKGFVTSFSYDPDGRRTSVITPEGLVTNLDYDPMGRILEIIDPAGVALARTYTLRGEVATEQRDGDGVVQYAYNLDGTRSSVADALGNTTTFTYDAVGRLATRVDATGAVEVMEYDIAGELVAQVDRLGQRTEITYDANGRIDTVADPSGRSTDHAYDTAGQLLDRSFGDGTTISYAYDDLGRRVSMGDPTGVTTYQYDVNGRPIEVAAPNGTLGYIYDLAGRRTGLTYPDGTTVTYDYDAAGRLVGLTDPNTGDVDYTLDDDGRLLLTGLPDGGSRSFEYLNGQMVSHQDSGRTTDVAYDESGRVATLSGAQNHAYGYDQAGQLVQASQDEGNYIYEYGVRGELTTITDPDRSRAFTHNSNVEIAAIVDGGGLSGSAVYDEAGRLTEYSDPAGTITSYSYDARGLLVEVVRSESVSGNDDPIPFPEPDPSRETTGKLEPIFECWTQDNGGTFTAWWGYENKSKQGPERVGRTVGYGSENSLTPVAFQGAQPDRFGIPGVIPNRPGRTAYGPDAPNAFAIAGWDGSEIVWELDGRTATATTDPKDQCDTTPAPPAAPEVTTETRTLDGDGVLIGVEIVRPDATISNDVMLWDRLRAVPEIVQTTSDAVVAHNVYGWDREVEAGQLTSFDVLGNDVGGGSVVPTWSPFGTDSGRDTIGYGYRGELETIAGVHLRARELVSDLGGFTTTDPLVGVASTPTVSNPYHYANNDPIGLTDPNGLRPSDSDLAGGTIGWETIARTSDAEALATRITALSFEDLDLERLPNALAGTLAHRMIQIDYRETHPNAESEKYYSSKNIKANGSNVTGYIDIVDWANPDVFFEIKPNTPGGRTDGALQVRQRVSDIAAGSTLQSAGGITPGTENVGNIVSTMVLPGLSMTVDYWKDIDGLILYDYTMRIDKNAIELLTLALMFEAVRNIGHYQRNGPDSGVPRDVPPKPAESVQSWEWARAVLLGVAAGAAAVGAALSPNPFDNYSGGISFSA